MPTTSDYLNQLIADKEAIEDNLEERGITVPSGATFTDLVPLVEGIPSGGDMSEYFDNISKTNTYSTGSSGWFYSIKKLPPMTITSSGNQAFMGFLGEEIEKITASSSTFNSMYFMFAYCSNLKRIDMSGIDTTDLSNTNGGCYSVFYNCKKLESIDFSNFQTNTRVYDYKYMFYNCEKLTSLDLKWIATTSNSKDYASMFSGCKKLAVLDISNLETTTTSSKYSSMFSNCGINCLQSDGAYANGIPYIYVKDSTVQDWILNSSNGHPSTWSTSNVIVRS